MSLDPALFLSFDHAAEASGLSVGRLRRLVKRGTLPKRLFGPVEYVYWPSIVKFLPTAVVSALGLAALTLPPRRTRLELLQLLRMNGYVDVTAARAAVGAGRTTIYRWAYTGNVSTFRLDRKLYLHWAELLRALEVYTEITHLDPQKPPVPQPLASARHIRGPRLMPGSEIERKLKAEGYWSVREAAREIGLPEAAVRRLVRESPDASKRWGSSVLVSMVWLKSQFASSH